MNRSAIVSVRGLKKYYGSDDNIVKALDGIDLDIEEGSFTAIVGASGSGKSTIAKLIAGFWDVKKGRITLSGHDLNEIPLPQLYNAVAFVSQDNYLFDETVRAI